MVGSFPFMDPHSEAEVVQIERLRAMTIDQRLATAHALRTFAWELKRAVLARQHPEWSETELLTAVRAAFR